MKTTVSITSIEREHVSPPRDLRPFTSPGDPGFAVFAIDTVEITVDHEHLRNVGDALCRLGDELIEMSKSQPAKVDPAEELQALSLE